MVSDFPGPVGWALRRHTRQTNTTKGKKKKKKREKEKIQRGNKRKGCNCSYAYKLFCSCKLSRNESLIEHRDSGFFFCSASPIRHRHSTDLNTRFFALLSYFFSFSSLFFFGGGADTYAYVEWGGLLVTILPKELYALRTRAKGLLARVRWVEHTVPSRNIPAASVPVAEKMVDPRILRHCHPCATNQSSHAACIRSNAHPAPPHTARNAQWLANREPRIPRDVTSSSLFPKWQGAHMLS